MLRIHIRLSTAGRRSRYPVSLARGQEGAGALLTADRLAGILDDLISNPASRALARLSDQILGKHVRRVCPPIRPQAPYRYECPASALLTHLLPLNGSNQRDQLPDRRPGYRAPEPSDARHSSHKRQSRRRHFFELVVVIASTPSFPAKPQRADVRQSIS